MVPHRSPIRSGSSKLPCSHMLMRPMPTAPMLPCRSRTLLGNSIHMSRKTLLTTGATYHEYVDRSAISLLELLRTLSTARHGTPYTVLCVGLPAKTGIPKRLTKQSLKLQVAQNAASLAVKPQSGSKGMFSLNDIAIESLVSAGMSRPIARGSR